MIDAKLWLSCWMKLHPALKIRPSMVIPFRRCTGMHLSRLSLIIKWVSNTTVTFSDLEDITRFVNEWNKQSKFAQVSQRQDMHLQVRKLEQEFLGHITTFTVRLPPLFARAIIDARYFV